MKAMESNPSVRRSRFFVVWLGIGLAVFAGCQSEPEPRDPNDILRTLLAETSGSAQFEQRSALPFETLRKAYDADENWVITRDEMQDRDWVRFDRNADDRLTLDDFPTESGALLERVELERAVVQRTGQAKPVFHQGGFARPVAVVHATELANQHMAFVQKHERVFGQVIGERGRRLARSAARQMAGVVFNALAMPNFT